MLGDFDDGGSGGGCFEGDFTGEDSLGGKEGGLESSSSSFFRSSLFLTSLIGESLTPNVVLFGEAKSFFLRSSTGDTDFTVFILAFEERESLLDVLLSFELFVGEETLGDFFAGLVSVSDFNGNLNVAGFAGLAAGLMEMLLLKFRVLGDAGIPFGIDDLGGGGGGGIPTSSLYANPESSFPQDLLSRVLVNIFFLDNVSLFILKGMGTSFSS